MVRNIGQYVVRFASTYSAESDLQFFFLFCFSYDFAADRSKPVITAINHKGQLGQRITMAECDLNQINRYYKCMDYITVLGPDGKPEPKRN